MPMNTSNYFIPIHGPPDYESQEWLDLSGLRLGMYLGSEPGWTDMPAKYWRSWALFWDDMAEKKEAEIRLLSANNEALRTQIQDLRFCLDNALALWAQNNDMLQQHARNFHHCLGQFGRPFVKDIKNKVRPLDLPDALEHQSNDKSRLSTVSLDNHVVNDVSVDRVSDDASVIAEDITLTSLTADDTSVSQATIKTANDICLN
ncbi:hypothetical protein C7999DRAFT_34639 [Corynascus novoguineensis]|uniref:Uncharacterized protein n=1 Tax=Corynascus novoguineensis TaxID=1126955 RepID=A0AAN7HCS4_9PEZI|nr:hypothetical protein C7999DRAFT_34639 [Corynascus novoguineensis]